MVTEAELWGITLIERCLFALLISIVLVVIVYISELIKSIRAKRKQNNTGIELEN